MSVHPCDVAAPPDALASICATDRTPGYWATDPAVVDTAHRRGVRVLLTELDEHDDRWLRNVTEPAHLADLMSLIDRLTCRSANSHQEHVAASTDAAEALSDEQQPIARTEYRTRDHNDRDDPRGASTAPWGRHSALGEPREPWPPDPEDVLSGITNLFERGSQQYRAADTGMPDLHRLWDRLDGDGKQLLAN